MFGMSLTEADAITGAIIGGLIVIIVYLVLRDIPTVRSISIERTRARSTVVMGEEITMRAGRYTEKFRNDNHERWSNESVFLSQQYGTTPPVSRGYYGAARPGRR